MKYPFGWWSMALLLQRDSCSAATGKMFKRWTWDALHVHKLLPRLLWRHPALAPLFAFWKWTCMHVYAYIRSERQAMEWYYLRLHERMISCNDVMKSYAHAGFILQHLGNVYCKHGWSLTSVMFLYEALGHLTCSRTRALCECMHIL